MIHQEIRLSLVVSTFRINQPKLLDHISDKMWEICTILCWVSLHLLDPTTMESAGHVPRLLSRDPLLKIVNHFLRAHSFRTNARNTHCELGFVSSEPSSIRQKVPSCKSCKSNVKRCWSLDLRKKLQAWLILHSIKCSWPNVSKMKMEDKKLLSQQYIFMSDLNALNKKVETADWCC